MQTEQTVRVEKVVAASRLVVLTMALSWGWLSFMALKSHAQEPGVQVAKEQERFFEEQVRPILSRHCFECHGVRKQESGLRLDSRAGMLQGGLSGPAIEPGKPDESLLIEAVRREGLEMPPETPMSPEEIQVLERWVQAGGRWPQATERAGPALGDQEAIGRLAASHWAFQPVRRIPPPRISAEQRRESGPLRPLDQFVVARLADQGLTISRRADRRTLIRRAYYDVIGLPPTAEQIDAFNQDPSPEAFQNVVDRLLDSPQYGERWGRHWLDIARYADTRDWRAQTDVRYPFAYTYRDYVVQALNDDKPYDQFIREQIAADFYAKTPDAPELAALGFLTVGPRFGNRRPDQIADCIDVVTRGVMSFTVSCARCHDHKYDPIPTADYYSLYGVFASTEIPERFPRIAGGDIAPDLLAAYQQTHAEKVAELEAYAEELREEAVQDLLKRMPLYFASYYEMSIAGTSQIRGVISKRKVKETAMTPLAQNLDRLLRMPRSLRDPVLGPLVTGLKMSEKEFRTRYTEWLSQVRPDAYHPHLITTLRSATPRSRQELLTVCAKVFEQACSSSEASLQDEALSEIRESLQASGGLFDFAPDQCLSASRLFGQGRRKINEYETAIREVEATHPGSPPRAMVVQDRARPIQPYVMLRGEANRRGESVPRRFLTLLSKGEPQPFADDDSGRQQLAEAVTSPDNPLTPRALVNRVWMKYFGRGLVATPGDFGLRAEPPSHPELLDYLAAFLMDHGWSLKQLHREILLSATYQQTSSPADPRRAHAQQRDPDNRLLWKQNRKRLDFEAYRDSLLAVSQRLNLTQGGRSVSLTEMPYTTRRTLYGYIDRVELDPIFTTFDFPSPDASSPSRPETTVPQQALFAMNHPFVIEQAKAIAADVRASTRDSTSQVAEIYRRVFGRSPSSSEAALAVAFVANPAPMESPTEQAWQYGYGPSLRVLDTAPMFSPLPHWTGANYQAGLEVPDRRLGHLKWSSNGGHPGPNASTSAILRWVSPIEGQVTLRGMLNHRRDKGDGVGACIVKGTELLGQWTAFHEEVETMRADVPVKVGDTIDFVVDCQQRATADAFLWSPTVQQVRGGRVVRVWNARRDFAAPPPPPLDVLEQFVQALLITNEFLYLD